MTNIIHDYKPLTVPKSIKKVRNLDTGKFFILINGKRVATSRTYLKYLNGTYDEHITELQVDEARADEIISTFKSLDKEFPFEIANFEYNGFFGRDRPGKAPYKAKFNKWSGDPGVAVMDCSDGKQRLVVTFAIRGAHLCLPSDETPRDKKLWFGWASRSWPVCQKEVLS